MSQAKAGDTVKVHYTGKLDDGTIFDSSKNRDPLEFKIGDGKIIPGFEKAVTGMAVDEEKTIKLMPEEAYGPHRAELIAKVPKKEIPENLVLQIGQQLKINQKDNPPIIATIVAVTDAEVTLDANHPLAGKDLTFELKLVKIA